MNQIPPIYKITIFKIWKVEYKSYPDIVGNCHYLTLST